ncbi:MAG: branched-chain amino acid ABC transporter substrate-binding protein [Actinobacteria bacterium]|nr:branched-chain amino acid ABC transporter substrate-binding protein [Actinomycetota bacterium]
MTGASIKAVAAAPGGAAATTTAGSGGGGAATGKTYTIAYQGPLSGDNQQLGINEDNAVQLAIEQANASAQLPFTLKYVNADDQGTPDGGPPAARKIVDNNNVVAVVGPAFSGATKASEPIFSQAGIASVSPSATNPTLTSQGFKTFFRVVPPDDAQGAEAAKFLAKYSPNKKIYLVDDTTEYGKGLADVIEKQLSGLGITVQREGVAQGTKDYSAIAQKVASASVDALYYSGYYADAALFAQALKSAGYKCLAMSGDGSNDDQFVTGAKDAGEGWLFSCPCGDARVDPNAASFAQAYKAKFNVDPGTYSPEAYDATNTIIAAMKTVSGDVTREKVATALRTIEYVGLTKTVKFQPSGEVVGSTIFVYGVAGGKRVLKGTTEALLK